MQPPRGDSRLTHGPNPPKYGTSDVSWVALFLTIGHFPSTHSLLTDDRTTIDWVLVI